jgi:RNA processing factor Prp31
MHNNHDIIKNIQEYINLLESGIMEFYSKSSSISSLINSGFKFKVWISAYKSDNSDFHSTPLLSWLQKHSVNKHKMQKSYSRKLSNVDFKQMKNTQTLRF